MNTASIAAQSQAQSNLRAHTASVRTWLVSTRCAILACAAIWLAYGFRVGADLGPYHMFEVVFFTGAVVLVTGVAWLLPFLGALLCMGASVASWLFLDTTPINALLAVPAFVLACLLLHRWHVERDAQPA
ncbi:MAG: hypothetical protein HZA53_13070 [Planctomycetes bacterium]|nr:hypothetical protein [Planctomycetota bacterium]